MPVRSAQIIFIQNVLPDYPSCDNGLLAASLISQIGAKITSTRSRFGASRIALATCSPSEHGDSYRGSAAVIVCGYIFGTGFRSLHEETVFSP